MLTGPEPAKKRLKSQPVSGDTPSSPMYTPSSPKFQSSGPPPTPGCPSCQTGMVDILRSVMPIRLGMKLQRCLLLTMMIIAQV